MFILFEHVLLIITHSKQDDSKKKKIGKGNCVLQDDLETSFSATKRFINHSMYSKDSGSA